MASLNLSSNGPSISKSYQAVVNASLPSGRASSPTHGQWALFSVSTPLVSAFQQDGGNKESVLKVQSSGEGELADLIDEFSEGKVQFAYVKVTDPNTSLPKNVLIAWCGEGVPERTKGYFTSHLSAVSKFLHGYHVQITARADGDLSPEGIIQKVADASGSKYSSEAVAPSPAPGPTSRPVVASKPVFTPTRTGGIGPKPGATGPKHSTASGASLDDDGWGPDAPPVTRTQLEKVQPAYQPTKVNLQELKAENTSRTNQQPAAAASDDRGDIVRGGYEPIGKVDIAAIRKQAAETGGAKDDRPGPVKGAYEPVGKVDIAEIRARAQKPEGAGARISSTATENELPKSLPERPVVPQAAERLTSLPKPKVANKFGTAPSLPGTKPALPDPPGSKSTSAAAQVGSASRTFADEGGKTPAQLWAERKARERGVPPSPVGTEAPSIQSQASGQGGWKPSYTGKTWAPVQTTHDKSTTSQQAADIRANEEGEEAETQESQSGVRDIRDQFAQDTSRPLPTQAPAPPVPAATRPVPVPGLPAGPTEPETARDAQQVLPNPPQQARSPTPPSPPVREGSPIRVAMPVGRSVTDARDEQYSAPPAMPVQSLQEAVPDEKDLEESAHDVGRAAAEAAVPDQPPSGGPRGLVQYDYEKAEDNEIDLREGEYVTEIEMVDKDWWLGVNAHGERGLFPGNYVEVVEDHGNAPTHGHEEDQEPVAATSVPAAQSPVAAPSSNGPTATALYDYEAAEDNELSFPEGVKIVNVDFPDDDWWLGEYNGARGLFPANYVQLDE